MISVRERQQFLTETKTKIIREIAGVGASGIQIQKMQGASHTDCDTSESLWDDVEPDPYAPLLGLRRDL